MSGKTSPRSTYKKVAQLDAINEKNPAGITSAEGSLSSTNTQEFAKKQKK